MASQQEAINLWRDLVGKLQPRQALRRGLVGDGAGNVAVTNRPGWIWIRYEEELNRLSWVRCFQGYPPEDTPVIIGKWHPEDDYEQVLGVYWGPYSMGMSDYQYAFHKVPIHGDTHHGNYGSDPAYIDYANLVMGRVAPTNPDSLFVTVESFVWADGAETKDYDGGTLDLTAEVPAGAGHKYLLVYFDMDSASVTYESGDVVALPASPSIPALDNVAAIPLAVIRMYNGQTAITIDDTWQRKLILGHVGGAGRVLEKAIVHEGDVVTRNGEIVWGI